MSLESIKSAIFVSDSDTSNKDGLSDHSKIFAISNIRQIIAMVS